MGEGFVPAATLAVSAASTGYSVYRGIQQQHQAEQDAAALKSAQDEQMNLYKDSQAKQEKAMGDQKVTDAASIDAINARNAALQKQQEGRRASSGRASTILTGYDYSNPQGQQSKTILGG